MWNLADPPFECYFTEVIPPNNFWWLSWFPSPPCLHFSSKFEWSPLWIFPKFSAIPPFGFSVKTDPQRINNYRSLMRFALIMQHANMAYRVQRAYKGSIIWLLSRGWYRWFQKKISWSLIWVQKSLLRKYLPYNSFVCQGKTFYHQRFWGKNSYANPWNHPYPGQSQMAGP